MPAGRRSLPLSPFFSMAGLPALLSLAGCVGLHVDSRPPRIQPSEVARHGLYLRAAALRDRELNWEIFDENLPALGITAVWVELENRRNAPADLSRCEWRLRVAGRERRALSAREVMGAYYEGRRIRMYSAKGDADARARLEKLILERTVLAPGARLSGYLFFRIGGRAGAGPAFLRAHNVGLDARTGVDLELPLAYANP